MIPSRKPKERKLDLNEFLDGPRKEGPPTKVYKPPMTDKINYIGSCSKSMMDQIDRTKLMQSRWTGELRPVDHRYWWDERFSLRLIEGFSREYINEHNFKCKPSFQTISRKITMFFMRGKRQGASSEFKGAPKDIKLSKL